MELETLIQKFQRKIMTKTLIILILLFDGELVKQKFELPIKMSVYECLAFSEQYRDVIAIYKDNGYYLKDGRGTIQGFIC